MSDEENESRSLLLNDDTDTEISFRHDSPAQDFDRKHASSKKLIQNFASNPELEENPSSTTILDFDDGDVKFWPYIKTTLNLAWKIALGMVFILSLIHI